MDIWNSTKQKTIIDKVAALIVKRVFKLVVNVIFCRQIAIILNDENIATPSHYANIKIIWINNVRFFPYKFKIWLYYIVKISIIMYNIQ